MENVGSITEIAPTLADEGNAQRLFAAPLAEGRLLPALRTGQGL
jgi:hypothetical protein